MHVSFPYVPFSSPRVAALSDLIQIIATGCEKDLAAILAAPFDEICDSNFAMSFCFWCGTPQQKGEMTKLSQDSAEPDWRGLMQTLALSFSLRSILGQEDLVVAISFFELEGGISGFEGVGAFQVDYLGSVSFKATFPGKQEIPAHLGGSILPCKQRSCLLVVPFNLRQDSSYQNY